MQTPIRNMRITFWGTRGSVQSFPGLHELQEYAHGIAVETATCILQEMLRRDPREGRCSVGQLLEGPLTEDAVGRLVASLRPAELPVYGGETTCASVETAEGNVFALDGGSGFRHFARELVRKWADRDDRTVHLLGTHCHLDHRIGVPFSDICFVRPHSYHVNVFGNFPFLAALDAHLAVFSKQIDASTYWDNPLDYSMLSATFTGTEIRPRPHEVPPPDLRHQAAGRSAPNAASASSLKGCGVHDLDQPIRIDSTTIVPFEVYHGPTPCLGYRIEHGDATFVFCTDHERRRGPDPEDPRQKASDEAEARVRAQCRDADVAYFDGQFLVEEYHGRRAIGSSLALSRLDWGHSCIEDCIERAVACRVKRTLLGHHDPDRSWSHCAELDERLRAESAGTGCHIQLAKDRCTIDL